MSTTQAKTPWRASRKTLEKIAAKGSRRVAEEARRQLADMELLSHLAASDQPHRWRPSGETRERLETLAAGTGQLAEEAERQLTRLAPDPGYSAKLEVIGKLYRRIDLGALPQTDTMTASDFDWICRMEKHLKGALDCQAYFEDGAVR